MLDIARKVAGRATDYWDLWQAKRRLAPLYSPDQNNLNIEQHLYGALEWLKRAQDAGTDCGISYGVFFGDEFDEATTTFSNRTGEIPAEPITYADFGGGAHWNYFINARFELDLGVTFFTSHNPTSHSSMMPTIS